MGPVPIRDPQGNVLATYEREYFSPTDFSTEYPGYSATGQDHVEVFHLQEYALYGSKRLGLQKNNQPLSFYSFTGSSFDADGYFSAKNNPQTIAVNTAPAITPFIRGQKFFELSNHLGNVLAVVSDRKLQVSAGAAHYFTADLQQVQDYYAFGMIMPERTISLGRNYRYGFQGQEKDDEVAGGGNSYSAQYWQYDSRLGRRWNVDPLALETPSWSPYRAFYNNPNMFIDPSGLQESTHTDASGNVIAVFSDGDLGIYQHQNAKTQQDVENLRNATNSNSGGGIKMGETLHELSFVNFETYETSNGKIIEGTGRIDFNSTWAIDEVEKIIKHNPGLWEYAKNAGNGDDWDLKHWAPYPAGPGANKPKGAPKEPYYGSLIDRKKKIYASARDAGNFAAGAVAELNWVPTWITIYGFGKFNQVGNSRPLLGLGVYVDGTLINTAIFASQWSPLTAVFTDTVGVGSVLYSRYFGEDKGSRDASLLGVEHVKK